MELETWKKRWLLRERKPGRNTEKGKTKEDDGLDSAESSGK
jgi:hypothetical protein